MGGERLEIGADLVADVALRGDAVGAGDHEIDQPVLHQMPAGVVGDHRMGNALLAELEGGERGALIARPGLVDPHMERHALLVGEIDRRRRRAPVDGGEPTRIAVGEHVDRRAQRLARRDLLDHREAVAADAEIDRDVLLTDFGGAGISGGDALAARAVAHRGHDLVERPFEVDRGRPGRDEAPIGALQRFVGGIVL